MNIITLQNDGAVINNQKTVESGLLMFLGFKVELGKDYTLRSYFQMIEKYPLLAEVNAFFSESMKKYSACPKGACTCNGFDYLEFVKTVEMIGFPGKPHLDIYHSLRGRHHDEVFEIKDIPLENLLDMTLRLGQLKHILLGDKVDTFEFETDYNLFEFIDGIAWELSFHGTPLHCEIRR